MKRKRGVHLKSHVYVLLHRGGELMKIGKANDVISRAGAIGMEFLDMRASFALRVQTARDALRIEQGLHRLFHGWRVPQASLSGAVPVAGKTEWFDAGCRERVVRFAEENRDLLGFEMATGQDLEDALAFAAEEAAQAGRQLLADYVDDGVFVPATPSTTRKTRKSTAERLMGLPDAFSMNTFINLLGIEKDMGKVYLSRWTGAGYLQSSGPRTGFYFNVLKNREAPSEFMAEAVRYVYPTALVRGATVLHTAGKTTQVPHQVDVAVLAPANRAKTNGFNEVPKPRSWYAAVHEMKAKEELFGLPALQPEMALADLYATKGDWHPDIDDLEVDELDWKRFKKACDILSIEVPAQLQELVARSCTAAGQPRRRRAP